MAITVLDTFTDGFEQYPSNSTTAFALGRFWNQATLPFGSNCKTTGRNGYGFAVYLRVGESLTYNPITSGQSMIVNFAVGGIGNAQSGVLCQFIGASGNHAALNVINGGLLQLKDPSGNVLGTGSTSISGTESQYNSIEVGITANTAGGTFFVRVNGGAEIALNTGVTGIDTTITGVSLNGLGNLLRVNYDDVYIRTGSGTIVSGDFIGDVRVYTDEVTANGSWAQGSIAGSSPPGSLYQCVSGSGTPDDTVVGQRYIQEATAGERSTFQITALNTAISTIHSVQVCAYAEKAGSGGASRTMKLTCNEHGNTANTDDGSQTYTLSSGSYRYYREVYTVNPDTSAAWSRSEVDAKDWGFKLVS